jgi:uncharacterized protein
MLSEVVVVLYPRILKPQLQEALRHFPVVLLTGARQVGKSTLAQQIIDNYITLDDLNIYSSLTADPQSFIASVNKPVVIDEIQKVPEILNSIKLTVDKNRVNGSFLLTGSANIMAYKNITDTLAGRIALMELMPLSRQEIAGYKGNLLDILFDGDAAGFNTATADKGQVIGKVIAGGFPEIQRIDTARGRRQWFSSYIKTYVERDIRDIGELRNIDKFLRMNSMLASRSGNLLNKADIARDAKINFKTLDNYLQLLKLVYQVDMLQPYSANLDKRLAKTEKLYFTDSGILAYLLNISNEADFAISPYRGSLFETYVFGELLKAVKYSEDRVGLFYFRTSDGQEVDFVIERGGKIIALEIKLAETVRREDFRHIAYLQSKVKNLQAGYVLYMGDRVLSFGERLYALPVSVLG